MVWPSRVLSLFVGFGCVSDRTLFTVKNAHNISKPKTLKPITPIRMFLCHPLTDVS